MVNFIKFPHPNVLWCQGTFDCTQQLWPWSIKCFFQYGHWKSKMAAAHAHLHPPTGCILLPWGGGLKLFIVIFFAKVKTMFFSKWPPKIQHGSRVRACAFAHIAPLAAGLGIKCLNGRTYGHTDVHLHYILHFDYRRWGILKKNYALGIEPRGNKLFWR